jgi:hypothetical protein
LPAFLSASNAATSFESICLATWSACHFLNENPSPSCL